MIRPMMTMAAVMVATPALAADVTVTLTGLKAKGGTVRLALYDEKTFLGRARHTATVAVAPTATAARFSVTLKGVPEGDYAVAAYHDADDNDMMTIGADGRMGEGTAMSNAEQLRGAPTFAATKVAVPASGLIVTLPMSYPEDRQGW